MAQVTLNATEAVHIDGGTSGSQQTTNYEGLSAQLDIGKLGSGTGERRRSLIQFDLSSIPATATVTGVTFKIYNQGTDLTNNARTMRAYRIRRNWTENQVTWNVYTTGNSWTTAGCSDTTDDRESSELGTISVINPPVAGYMSSTFSTSLIQEWVDGTFTNNGLIWIMDTESDDMQRFDGEDDSNPPQLVIDYDLPSGGFIYMSQ